MNMLWVVIVVVLACLAGSAPARQCPPAGNITRYWDGAVGQCSKCSGPACRSLNPTPRECLCTCADMFPGRAFFDDEGRSCGPKPTTGVMPTESPNSGMLIAVIVLAVLFVAFVIAVGMGLVCCFDKVTTIRDAFKKKLSKAKNEHGDVEENKPLNDISDTSMPSAINLAGRDSLTVPEGIQVVTPSGDSNSRRTATDGHKRGTQLKQRGTLPNQPSTQPNQPSTQPTKPSTQPNQQSTQPNQPSTQPKQRSTQPSGAMGVSSGDQSDVQIGDQSKRNAAVFTDVQIGDQTIPKDFPADNTLVIDQPSGGLDEDSRLHYNTGSYGILKNGKEDAAGIQETTDNQAT